MKDISKHSFKSSKDVLFHLQSLTINTGCCIKEGRLCFFERAINDVISIRSKKLLRTVVLDNHFIRVINCIFKATIIILGVKNALIGNN